MKTQIFFDGNDMLLRVVGVLDIARDKYVNNATGSVTLVDSGDTPLTGETWPLALAYVTNSDGIYQATLADAIVTTPVIDQIITAKITIDGGAGFKGYWETPFDVKVRAL